MSIPIGPSEKQLPAGSQQLQSPLPAGGSCVCDLPQGAGSEGIHMQRYNRLLKRNTDNSKLFLIGPCDKSQNPVCAGIVNRVALLERARASRLAPSVFWPVKPLPRRVRYPCMLLTLVR